MDLTKTYNEKFYGDQQEAYVSAQKVLGLVYHYYEPSSVVDIGCGLGTWLKVWQELDFHIFVAGLDGNDVADRRFIPESLYAQVDLTKDYQEVLSQAISLKWGGASIRLATSPFH